MSLYQSLKPLNLCNTPDNPSCMSLSQRVDNYFQLSCLPNSKPRYGTLILPKRSRKLIGQPVVSVLKSHKYNELYISFQCESGQMISGKCWRRQLRLVGQLMEKQLTRFTVFLPRLCLSPLTLQLTMSRRGSKRQLEPKLSFYILVTKGWSIPNYLNCVKNC